MNVLAIGAYPSEIVLLCGGTLARYALAGHSVSVLAMCRSVSRYPEPNEEIAQLYAREYRNAAAVIGAATYHLQLRQFDLKNDYETRLKITEIIRQVQPGVIFTHDSNDYARDHRTTSDLTTESMFMSKQAGIKTGSPVVGYHPYVVFMDTVSGLGFDPEQYVDITKVIDLKRRMVMAFEHEVEEFKDSPVLEPIEWMEITARYRGVQGGHRYAEAFRWPHRWGFMADGPMLI